MCVCVRVCVCVSVHLYIFVYNCVILSIMYVYVYNVLSMLQASGEAQYVSDMIVSNALSAAFVLSTEVHMMCNHVCIIIM